MADESARKREISHEKDPRSPDEFRSARKGPPPGRESRGRGASTETPSSSSRNPPPPSNDPYYQDYQGKPYAGQQYGYDYYSQREWGYDSYNAPYDRAAAGPPSAERGYNYSTYDYNNPSYDYNNARGGAAPDLPFQGNNRGKDDNRNDRPDPRSTGKYPEQREAAGYRQQYENRDAWSTPGDKGGRNRENLQSGRGNGPHTGGSQQKRKDHPPSLRTPR